MKTYVVQLICWGGLLTVLSACRPKEPEAVGAIIETAIPNGLVPGSALTLKGRDFGSVTSVAFANTTVAVSAFIRTATDELTLKVPLGTQSGEVRVIGEKGPGQPKTMALLTGYSGLTADNVSTNVNTIAQSSFSDPCSPTFMSFCYEKSCIGYLIANNPTASGCNQGYYFIEKSVETIGAATYEVFKPRAKYQQVLLKFEKNNSGNGYTGFVLIQTPNGDNYVGNVLKDNNITGYSLSDGSQIKLCRTDLKDHYPRTRDDLCPPSGCPTCQ